MLFIAHTYRGSFEVKYWNIETIIVLNLKIKWQIFNYELLMKYSCSWQWPFKNKKLSESLDNHTKWQNFCMTYNLNIVPIT